VTHSDPSTLDTRGSHLRSDLRKLVGNSTAALVLIDEACRIVDRLDKLDRLLSGDAESWIDIIEGRGHSELELTINAPLAEARQQALALKQLFTELRQMGVLGIADPDTAKNKAEGGEDDELAARRKTRLADAARREHPGI
jgi:hypothetical protein